MEKRKQTERRKGDRRRKINEHEFKRLIESGKVTARDHRAWKERRKPKRRKRQVGV